MKNIIISTGNDIQTAIDTVNANTTDWVFTLEWYDTITPPTDEWLSYHLLYCASKAEALKSLEQLKSRAPYIHPEGSVQQERPQIIEEIPHVYVGRGKVLGEVYESRAVFYTEGEANEWLLTFEHDWERIDRVPADMVIEIYNGFTEVSKPAFLFLP